VLFGARTGGGLLVAVGTALLRSFRGGRDAGFRMGGGKKLVGFFSFLLRLLRLSIYASNEVDKVSSSWKWLRRI